MQLATAGSEGPPQLREENKDFFQKLKVLRRELESGVLAPEQLAILEQYQLGKPVGKPAQPGTHQRVPPPCTVQRENVAANELAVDDCRESVNKQVGRV